MLLSLYVFSLIVGGVFVGLSVFSGIDKSFSADADVDVDADIDADIDVDADVDVDVDADAHIDVDKNLGFAKSFDKDVETGAGRRFRPWTSFKFWTFFMGFFGLTGTLFTVFSLWSSAGGVFALSSLLGLFAGFGISYGLHVANSSVGGKMATEDDFVGSSAKVVLPISGEMMGKVKVRYKGRLMELPARPMEDEEGVIFAFDEECVILDVEGGVARVASAASVYGKR